MLEGLGGSFRRPAASFTDGDLEADQKGQLDDGCRSAVRAPRPGSATENQAHVGQFHQWGTCVSGHADDGGAGLFRGMGRLEGQRVESTVTDRQTDVSRGEVAGCQLLHHCIGGCFRGPSVQDEPHSHCGCRRPGYPVSHNEYAVGVGDGFDGLVESIAIQW